MKRVLYIDLISPAGHDNFDMNLLRLMSQHYEVDVMLRGSMIERIPQSFYHSISACPDVIFPEEWHKKTSSKSAAWAWRKEQYKFIKGVLKEKGNKYDYIFFSSVDIFSYALASRFVMHNKFSFVDHGIYRLKNKLTRFFYKHVLRHDIRIVALEEYVAKFMFDNGIVNPISVIHHPIPLVEKGGWKKQTFNATCLVFAPSTSNDESFVAELIVKQGKIPATVKIVIKSHHLTSDSERLNVFNSRMAQEEYEKAFTNADFILIPYEPSYNYRTSAILFESLAYGKRVLLWGNNTLKNYFIDYRDCVCVFSDVDDLLIKLSTPQELHYDKDEIERFIYHYSDDYITHQIEQVIN